ncbi:DUF3618 domain-containing protein [Microbispora sp. NPDC049125]|uniref:DUF3618 domain-containing protein n=1 Tax=Microbispora sp. NPDC049125 TaxID=3154929 RepID=UPI0034677197
MADTDPDALEREIERTRAELARTVDAIADRVSPKRVAERGVVRFKTNAVRLVSSLGELVGAAPRSVAFAENGEGPAEEGPAESVAPVLIGIGAVVVLGAAIVLVRRRNHR